LVTRSGTDGLIDRPLVPPPRKGARVRPPVGPVRRWFQETGKNVTAGGERLGRRRGIFLFDGAPGTAVKLLLGHQINRGRELDVERVSHPRNNARGHIASVDHGS
jgi:hypothetical protein